jgi:uncharacterized membrane protein YphA (DoxX/SURF4 family)
MGNQTKVMTWTGWVLTVLIGLMMTFGGVYVLTDPPELKEQFVGKFGYPEDLALAIGIVELCCAALYLIPRTSILGAVLLTGYLGGAVATHVRIHDNFVTAVIVGMLVWLAVYLRDPRVRALLPFRRPIAPPGTSA